MRKKRSSDREKLLKLEAEGQKFANILRSPEQFFKQLLVTCSWRFLRSNKLEQLIQIGKNYWDLETCRKN